MSVAKETCQEKVYRFICGVSLRKGQDDTEEEARRQEEEDRQKTLQSLDQDKNARCVQSIPE